MPTSLLFRSAAKRRRQTVIGGSIIVLLTVVIFIGVWQLDTIREFFSHASGEEAQIMVDTQAVLGTMPRPWRNLAQGGEDHAWRLQPLAGQVGALHPAYIRLDHIYDFYDVVGGSPGNLTYDFSKLDLVLDDIAATGAKPYIALSYMPPAISSGDITAPPHNWGDWQQVVARTIQHISGTRGTRDVYYEVWNEPDLFGGWKYYGERNYLTMYSYAAAGADQAARAGVQSFKLGGPATTALYKNWFDAVAKHAVANNLRYDFFSWHRYSHEVDQYKQDMVEVRDWIRAYPQLEATLEFHITEWGHDSDVNKGYDTSYGAAHSVAGAIEMVGTVERAFAFEIQDGKDPAGQPLWGRWGLFSHADFGAQAKPRYYGLKMLDSIADQRLQVLGKGSWVKALAARNDAGHTEVILSNYDNQGRHAEVVPVTFQNIQPGSYQVDIKFLDGRQQRQQLATDAAVLRTEVTMPINSVAKLELIKQ